MLGVPPPPLLAVNTPWAPGDRAILSRTLQAAGLLPDLGGWPHTLKTVSTGLAPRAVAWEATRNKSTPREQPQSCFNLPLRQLVKC